MENRTLKLVKLSGGLGNQLFQYCFGLYLKRSFHTDVCYFDGMDPVPGRTALDTLVGNVNRANTKTLKENHYFFNSMMAYRLQRKLLLTFPRLSNKILVENGSNYLRNLPDSYRVFDGYWQSYHYLESLELGKALHFPEDVQASIFLEDIEKSNAVFVHIRRGDYMKQQGIFHICPPEYFQEACARVQQTVSNPVFYIFSNDSKWVRSHIGLDTDYTCKYVEHQGEHADLKDFLCMTRCRHAVISNSTFSWWAAWLIDNAQKCVIAPREWYTDQQMNERTSNLIPGNWTRL